MAMNVQTRAEYSVEAVTAQTVHVKLSPQQVGRVLKQIIWDRLGRPDDAGCDWYTTRDGRVLIAADPDWQVADNRELAILVDAMNLLVIGEVLRVED